jgi:diguanylate cyclase (GGDEF)-like protein
MPAAEVPPDESLRLESLERIALLDTAAEERFDRLTRLAQRYFRVPWAMLTLVDERRQWHKSSQGENVEQQLPRAISFCAHTILKESPLVVADATDDPRFSDNPMVTGEMHVRFYAGVPLHSLDGHRVGTFCIVDNQRRDLNSEDLRALRDFAACAETELQLTNLSHAGYELLAEMDELSRKASVDALTRAWNRASILELLDKELERARRKSEPLALAILDVDHFKQINDTYGHPAGDVVLREIASRIRSAIRTYDAFGRYGGEEFLIVVPDCGRAAAVAQSQRILDCLLADPIVADGHSLRVSASLGVAAWDGESSADLIKRADEALYRAKDEGRSRVVLAKERDGENA